MSLVLIVYLMGIIPSVQTFLSVVGGLSATVLLGTAFFCTIEKDGWSSEEKCKRLDANRKRALKCLIAPCSMLFIAGLIPSEKTMYTMAAVYAGQKIAETPQAQQIGNDAFDVLKGILNKAKKELAEETPKSANK